MSESERARLARDVQVPAVMTGRQASRYLQMGHKQFLRHVNNGTIPCWVDSDTGWRRYPKAALDAWLLSHYKGDVA